MYIPSGWLGPKKMDLYWAYDDEFWVRLDLSWAASGRSERELLHSFCSPFFDILALTAPLRSRNILDSPEISGPLTPALCCLRAGLLLWALLRCSRSTRLRSRLRLRPRSGGAAW